MNIGYIIYDRGYHSRRLADGPVLNYQVSEISGIVKKNEPLDNQKKSKQHADHIQYFRVMQVAPFPDFTCNIHNSCFSICKDVYLLIINSPARPESLILGYKRPAYEVPANITKVIPALFTGGHHPGSDLHHDLDGGIPF